MAHPEELKGTDSMFNLFPKYASDSVTDKRLHLEKYPLHSEFLIRLGKRGALAP